MAVKDFFKRLFTKREEPPSETLDRIKSSLNILMQKADNLSGRFENEKHTIEEIVAEAGKASPSANVRAAKFEQDILTSLTSASGALDEVLTGADSAGLSEALNSLRSLVRQRARMK